MCHGIYVAGAELVNSRVPTTQLQSASKFLWRPDLRPRLADWPTSRARESDLWVLASGGEVARHLVALSEPT